MLRAILHDFLRPRVLRFRINCATGTPVAEIGGEELTSITDNGVGDFTLNFRFPFARTPLVVASPRLNAAAGSYVGWTTVSPTSIRLVIYNSAGTAEDTQCSVFVLGYDSSYLSIARPEQSLVGPGRNPRVVVGSVAADGTALVNFGSFASSRSSAGVYTITPRIPFGNIPVVVAGANQTTVAHVRTSAEAAGSFVVETFNTSGAATDTAFSFIAGGIDARDAATARMLRVVREGSIAPRIVAVAAASGNASLTSNAAIGSIASGGTGIGDITLTTGGAAFPSRQFRRLPVAIATANGNVHAQVNTTAATGTQVRTFNAAGSAAAAASHVVLFGWDNAQTSRSR